MTTQRESGSGDWRAEHLQRYLETSGEDGYLWHGVPTLLLTTTGRRSGQRHTTPLIFGQDGDRYLVVGSRGGAPQHPAWYHNLVANSDVEVQVKGDRFKARARPATPEEKPGLWRIMTGIYPPYDEYQTRTSRQIPVVIIERV
jgi:deazaflavin-dependent oxidoreductase (nitroreductase family)